jgi:hypothetical protein
VRSLAVAAASGAWGCATETSGVGSASSDLKSEDVLSWVAESFGTDDAASSIGAMSGGVALGADAATWALGSDDVAACCGAAMSEVGELVASVVAPISVSASGASAVASALISGEGAT